MTRSEIYAAYAQTGRTARQIADELGVTVHAVHQACQRAGQPLARGRHQKAAGFITVHLRICKSTRQIYPSAFIPMTALRAAGLHFKRKLSFVVDQGRIIIAALPQTPKEHV